MKKNITSVAIIVIRKNKKYLLTHRISQDPEDEKYRDYWQLPGGGQEYKEPIEKTILREAIEELGKPIKIIKFIPKIFDAIRDNWHGLLHCYLCKFLNSHKPIILNEEADRYQWFTAVEVKKLKTYPHTYQIIREAEKI